MVLIESLRESHDNRVRSSVWFTGETDPLAPTAGELFPIGPRGAVGLMTGVGTIGPLPRYGGAVPVFPLRTFDLSDEEDGTALSGTRCGHDRIRPKRELRPISRRNRK